MMTTPVGRFAHTFATANRELPIPIGSPKSFDTVRTFQDGNGRGRKNEEVE
jgi:hypothetical protein